MCSREQKGNVKKVQLNFFRKQEENPIKKQKNISPSTMTKSCRSKDTPLVIENVCRLANVEKFVLEEHLVDVPSSLV